MSLIEEKANFFDVVYSMQEKKNKAQQITGCYFTPDMTDNMDKYLGEISLDESEVCIRIAAKGLRYENRTLTLEKLSVGDAVLIQRDIHNTYNANNFNITTMQGESLGVLPAELCNAMAPLYDAQSLLIQRASVVYIEKIGVRSRYAQQGILFVELKIKLLI